MVTRPLPVMLSILQKAFADANIEDHLICGGYAMLKSHMQQEGVVLSKCKIDEQDYGIHSLSGLSFNTIIPLNDLGSLWPDFNPINTNDVEPDELQYIGDARGGDDVMG